MHKSDLIMSTIFGQKKHIVETPTLKCVCICLSWKSFRPREKTSPGIVDYKPLAKPMVFGLPVFQGMYKYIYI